MEEEKKNDVIGFSIVILISSIFGVIIIGSGFLLVKIGLLQYFLMGLFGLIITTFTGFLILGLIGTFCYEVLGINLEKILKEKYPILKKYFV